MLVVSIAVRQLGVVPQRDIAPCIGPNSYLIHKIRPILVITFKKLRKL